MVYFLAEIGLLYLTTYKAASYLSFNNDTTSFCLLIFSSIAVLRLAIAIASNFLTPALRSSINLKVIGLTPKSTLKSGEFQGHPGRINSKRLFSLQNL